MKPNRNNPATKLKICDVRRFGTVEFNKSIFERLKFQVLDASTLTTKLKSRSSICAGIEGENLFRWPTRFLFITLLECTNAQDFLYLQVIARAIKFFLIFVLSKLGRYRCSMMFVKVMQMPRYLLHPPSQQPRPLCLCTVCFP